MFVANEPALLINRCLIVGDLHIGLSKEMYDAGVMLPSQAEKFVKKLNRLKTETGAERLVILGDMKHRVAGISFLERKEIHRFLSGLDFKKITIVKGNHDGHIEKAIQPDVKNKVVVRKSIAIGKYYLTHGHRRARTGKKIIIIAHNHPKIKFVDDMGAKYIEPVWIKAGLRNGKRLVIMPSFNELSGSMVVNDPKLSDKNHKGFMGPVAKNIVESTAKVYLLDGTYLGYLKDL